LERIRVSHDIQHSQRALPALTQGKNLVTVTVGPPESTITLQASTKLEWRGKQLVYTDFHPQLKGIEANLMRVEGSEGEAIFTVSTPADMVRLRCGVHYRARDQMDG
jgi:hypothetical protein